MKSLINTQTIKQGFNLTVGGLLASGSVYATAAAGYGLFKLGNITWNKLKKEDSQEDKNQSQAS